MASKKSLWQIGGNYFIKTVTDYISGQLVEVTDQELWLKDAAWIADTGERQADVLKSCNFGEVEPYPSGQIIAVGRGALVAANLIPTLPRDQK